MKLPDKERVPFLNIIDFASYYLKHGDIPKSEIIILIKKELKNLEES